MRRPPGRVLAALIVFSLGVIWTAHLTIDFLRKPRDFPAEIPSPSPVNYVDLVIVKGHQLMCMTDVAMEEHSELALFKAGTYGKPGPRLDVSIQGPGYTQHSSVKAGWPDNAVVAARFKPPQRSTLVKVCIRNGGRNKIAFYAASDRARSRVNVTVDGETRAPTPTFSFYEAKAVSVKDRASIIAGRIATFRGFLDHAWLVWVLAGLAVIGVPLLLLWGLGDSLLREEAPPPENARPG